MSNRVSLSVAAVILVMATIQPYISSAEESQVSDNDSALIAGCCDKDKAAWYFERRINGEVMDSGVFNARIRGVSYLVYPSSHGGMVRIMVVMPPVPKDTPPTDIDPTWRLYNGIVFNEEGLLEGRITAVENTPGEEWLFQYLDDTIIDDEGYDQGTVARTIKLHTEEVDETWEIKVSNGDWYIFPILNQPADFVFGSSGCQWEELSPKARDATWVEVDLPDGKGHFYGLAYSMDTVWSVTIDGETFSAQASDIHEDATIPQQH